MSAAGNDPAFGCDKVLLVQAEIDGELGAAEAAALEAHRAGCPVCQAARTELLRARMLVRGEPAHSMSEAVRARIMAALPATRPRPAPAWNWRWLRGPGIGFGLGAACAAALSLLILLPGPRDVAGDIVAAHIRALQPGHLEDVVSTDRHTVKPWFDGKIDFAPPVEDFAAKGYPLTGGRIDYAAGRPVAALVYRRDKHVIDLFIWPASKPGALPLQRIAGAQGYNVVHWRAEGMEFWAISDVEAVQLDAFAKLWPHAS